MITVENIINIASYLTKIHHVKGRIRVRVSPKIKEQSQGVTVDDIMKLPQKIDGIQTLKINKVVGSITIVYDNDIFPYDLWEDLLSGKNLEKISKILNKLEKEV